MSEWNRRLSQEQQNYAAIDVYVSFYICRFILTVMRHKMSVRTNNISYNYVNKQCFQASQLIFQKIKELEYNQKIDKEISLLLMNLQNDFQKEEEIERHNEYKDELVTEYEKLQSILNKI